MACWGVASVSEHCVFDRTKEAVLEALAVTVSRVRSVNTAYPNQRCSAVILGREDNRGVVLSFISVASSLAADP